MPEKKILISGHIEKAKGVTTAEIALQDDKTKSRVMKRFESTCPELVFVNIANFYSEFKRA